MPLAMRAVTRGTRNGNLHTVDTKRKKTRLGTMCRHRHHQFKGLHFRLLVRSLKFTGPSSPGRFAKSDTSPEERETLFVSAPSSQLGELLSVSSGAKSERLRFLLVKSAQISYRNYCGGNLIISK